MNPYISAPKNLLYFSLLFSCQKRISRLSRLKFRDVPKLQNRLKRDDFQAFRIGIPKRNCSLRLFSVFVTLDEFEHCLALNTLAIPDTERRNFVFVQKPQHGAAADLQNLLTLMQCQNIGILVQIHVYQPFCAVYCTVLHRKG